MLSVYTTYSMGALRLCVTMTFRGNHRKISILTYTRVLSSDCHDRRETAIMEICASSGPPGR